jgi:hypothetical protein
VLAAGGDPTRDLSPDEPAVGTLARDLDSPSRRLDLAGALSELAEESDGLPRVAASLDGLLADDGLAWRWAACALLAEELADG